MCRSLEVQVGTGIELESRMMSRHRRIFLALSLIVLVFPQIVTAAHKKPRHKDVIVRASAADKIKGKFADKVGYGRADLEKAVKHFR